MRTFRGLGHMRTLVLDGMKIHYNHVCKHDAIKKTPAEAAGIHMAGANKWKTIMQNSSFYLKRPTRRYEYGIDHTFCRTIQEFDHIVKKGNDTARNLPSTPSGTVLFI